MDNISNLSEFIASLGDAEFAKRFGLIERTVASWRRGERIPRPKVARALVDRSGGLLTMAMIYAQPSVVAASDSGKKEA